MSFGGNNSRNIANLLRFDPLQIPQKRQLPALINPPASGIAPTNQPPRLNSRQRPQIPLQEVFTPQQRTIRRKTEIKGSQDHQLQSLRVRLQQIVRYYDERHTNLESKTMVRLNELENFIMKEVPRLDNTTMVSADLNGVKESLKELRKQQEQQAHQMAILRMDKSSDQYAALSKQKQKVTVLFMELVRLGESVDKINNQIGSVSNSYENKIFQLESKLTNSEKNVAIMSHRTANGSEMVAQFGDKFMNRLQTTENNLLILGKEQVRDKQIIARLTVQNQRLSQDLQLLLRNMQSDFQNRLQNKVSETVNKLMIEHDDRIRSHDQIRKNLDLKQRANLQRLSNDKMQSRSRYDSMDALIRNEFMKKEQAIRALHIAIEEKSKSMNAQLREQQSKRKEQQMQYRNELKRVQDSLRAEYELYRSHESAAIEKFSQIVKTQVQVRLSSELDLKKMTSDLVTDIVTDLNNLKETVFASNKKMNQSMRQLSQESSQRSGQLSHYVDMEVHKLAEVVSEKYNKMKNVFSKIAQQLRSHLLATEANRKNVQSRLSSVEGDFQKMKSEVNSQIDQFYNDLETRLKEEKDFVQTVVFKKNNDLTLRVSKLQQYTNQYFQLLKAGIEDNKDLLNKRIGNNSSQGNANVSEEEMKQLRLIVFNIRNLTEALKEETQGDLRDIRKDLVGLEGKQKQRLLEQEEQIDKKISLQSEQIKGCDEKVDQLSLKINSLRTENNGGDKIKVIHQQMETLKEKVYLDIDKVKEDILRVQREIKK